MNNTSIEWTDSTWNPIRGCSVVSEGCRNCYAMQIAARFSDGGQAYEGLAYRNESGAHWTGQVALIEKRLQDPLKWKHPRRIFVNSMSDLFHETVPDVWIDHIFAVMALAPQHTYQVLTKRPKRMRAYMNAEWRVRHVAEAWAGLNRAAERGIATPAVTLAAMLKERWPLPNLWIGTSIEDQKTADERIWHLRSTPAAIRFISYEPALGAVHTGGYCYDCCAHMEVDGSCLCADGGRLDWWIVGGESGRGARPCNLAWLRAVAARCQFAEVACFVKQLGSVPMVSQHTWMTDGALHLLSAGNRKRVPEGFVPLRLSDGKGGNIEEFPDDLKVREFPAAGRAHG